MLGVRIAPAEFWPWSFIMQSRHYKWTGFIKNLKASTIVSCCIGFPVRSTEMASTRCFHNDVLYIPPCQERAIRQKRKKKKKFNFSLNSFCHENTIYTSVYIMQLYVS